jgi:hypothetical protein
VRGQSVSDQFPDLRKSTSSPTLFDNSSVLSHSQMNPHPQQPEGISDTLYGIESISRVDSEDAIAFC